MLTEETELKEPVTEQKQIVLSGIRATGSLHFGNFFGAVAHFLKHQRPENTCMYFIADYHTLTTGNTPEMVAQMKKDVLEIALDYLAVGLDPNQSMIYAQSSTDIFELYWYLATFQSSEGLKKLGTIKEKADEETGDVNLALLSYPVLMAADILGPQATLVPVGEDQVIHVELACDLAKKFNRIFGKTFVIPKLMKEMIKIPGLDGGKMGKSDGKNAIDIHSPIDEIRKKYIKHGDTDIARTGLEVPGNPKACKSVYPLHKILSEEERKSGEIAKLCSTAAIGCVDCKHRLVDLIAKHLVPFQEKRRELDGNYKLAREVLHEGGKKANAVIRETTERVRDKMGIVIY